MNEGEKILWNALNQIAWGSEDNEPPFRAAPREVLIELARKALKEYRSLTTTLVSEKHTGRYCADCNTLIGPDEFSCPKCGGCL